MRSKTSLPWVKQNITFTICMRIDADVADLFQCMSSMGEQLHWRQNCIVAPRLRVFGLLYDEVGVRVVRGYRCCRQNDSRTTHNLKPEEIGNRRQTESNQFGNYRKNSRWALHDNFLPLHVCVGHFFTICIDSCSNVDLFMQRKARIIQSDRANHT